MKKNTSRRSSVVGRQSEGEDQGRELLNAAFAVPAVELRRAAMHLKNTYASVSQGPGYKKDFSSCALFKWRDQAAFDAYWMLIEEAYRLTKLARLNPSASSASSVVKPGGAR